MQVQPYPFFEGRRDEALDFYTRALDAPVTALMRCREAPDPPPPGMLPPGSEDKFMHASIRVRASDLMSSDGFCSGTQTFRSSCFGMLTDRYGVGWMVMVAQESPR